MTGPIVYADGPHAPRADPRLIAELTRVDATRQVVLGWMVERPPWLDDPTFAVTTTFSGYGLADAVAQGRVTASPLRLSEVPAMLQADPPSVAVVTGTRRGDDFAFAGSVGWADVAARLAARVVVEIDTETVDLGAPLIEGNIVATLERPHATSAGPASGRTADHVDLTIGAAVVAQFPDRPTIQLGPGGIAEGIALAIDSPVYIRSGLVTDPIAELGSRGFLADPAEAAYTWGGEPIARLAASGGLTLRSVTATHDLTRLASIPRFVSCNTALQVGLDGSVNVERIRSRIVASVGGHPDFCAAASRSQGGCSIIALRSTTSRGASTIVPGVEVVSTSGRDVGLVITEHGVADLRAVGGEERAARLIAIASPGHRDSLHRSLPT